MFSTINEGNLINLSLTLKDIFFLFSEILQYVDIYLGKMYEN